MRVKRKVQNRFNPGKWELLFQLLPSVPPHLLRPPPQQPPQPPPAGSYAPPPPPCYVHPTPSASTQPLPQQQAASDAPPLQPRPTPPLPPWAMPAAATGAAAGAASGLGPEDTNPLLWLLERLEPSEYPGRYLPANAPSVDPRQLMWNAAFLHRPAGRGAGLHTRAPRAHSCAFHALPAIHAREAMP